MTWFVLDCFFGVFFGVIALMVLGLFRVLQLGLGRTSLLLRVHGFYLFLNGLGVLVSGYGCNVGGGASGYGVGRGVSSFFALFQDCLLCYTIFYLPEDHDTFFCFLYTFFRLRGCLLSLLGCCCHFWVCLCSCPRCAVYYYYFSVTFSSFFWFFTGFSRERSP